MFVEYHIQINQRKRSKTCNLDGDLQTNSLSIIWSILVSLRTILLLHKLVSFIEVKCAIIIFNTYLVQKYDLKLFKPLL